MEWLQTILESNGTPAVTAFVLGVLTAISPCPLATNIAAIGYISKDIEERKRIFLNGFLYTIGRIAAYTVLGIIILSILKEGAGIFGIQKQLAKWGELILGPLLILIGLYMLLGQRLNLPKFGFSGNGERLAGKGGWGSFLLGILFSLAFCPSSAIFYFGMLMPISVTAQAGWLLPVVYAIATAVPVLVISWILAFSLQQLSGFYGKMRVIQKWLNIVVGVIFVLVGFYYCFMMYF